MSRYGNQNQHTNNLPDFPYSMRFAKAKAMLDMGQTYADVQAATGLCRESITRVKNGERAVLDSAVKAIKDAECDKISFVSHRIIESINDRDLEKASLQQKAISFCALVDKRELLAGRATSRTAHAHMTDPALDAEIERLESELADWQDGKVVNVNVEALK